MSSVRAVVAMLSLSVASCDAIAGVFGSASLQVTVPTGQTQVGSRVFVNGLDDPKGLAGFEVEVSGQGMDRQVFTAGELPSHRFGVPDSGTINVNLRLRQDGVVVAEGRATWTLKPDVEWSAKVDRTWLPSGMPDNFTGPNPIGCAWFWCHSVWRFEIQPAARNYEDEALWLTVSDYAPGECADVC